MPARTALIALSLLVTPVRAEPPPQTDPWLAIGPNGGDVRSLALDPSNPNRVYLGAAGGSLYRSDEGGTRWQRLSPGFPRRDQNLDEMVVTPLGNLLIGFWDVHGRGGGVALSRDGGATFSISLDGESVRALSLAPSDPAIAVAGARSGAFASSDGGSHWRRISPIDHSELRNIESIAIDPRDPRIIYVGTWHLPWKTTDGGISWRPMPAGMIEDSDVFTMTLDRRDPQVVHATACSGIYGSANGGALWSRSLGIPFSSRRSRAFAQDPSRPQTFYAGTTEGLWVSEDDTRSWTRTTPLDVVVNTIVARPDGSVLLGVDGAGVLRSVDRGRTWSPANEGFSERRVSRIAFDPRSRRILAAVWGDRRHGGVFSAPAPRGAWSPLADGLKGRDVSSLAVAVSSLLAGTDEGLFALSAREGMWRRIAITGPRGASPRIHDLAVLHGDVVIAATSMGLFRSEDAAATWRPVLTDAGETTAVALLPRGSLSIAAAAFGLQGSRDEGRSWRPLESRPGRARVNALSVLSGSPDVILAATSLGLYRSVDEGATWTLGGGGLPESDFTSIALASDGGAVFASDFTWGGVYRSDDRGAAWTRLDATGLSSDRVWALGIEPSDSLDLLAASLVGGLHVLTLPGRRQPDLPTDKLR